MGTAIDAMGPSADPFDEALRQLRHATARSWLADERVEAIAGLPAGTFARLERGELGFDVDVMRQLAHAAGHVLEVRVTTRVGSGAALAAARAALVEDLPVPAASTPGPGPLRGYGVTGATMRIAQWKAKVAASPLLRSRRGGSEWDRDWPGLVKLWTAKANEDVDIHDVQTNNTSVAWTWRCTQGHFWRETAHSRTNLTSAVGDRWSVRPWQEHTDRLAPCRQCALEADGPFYDCGHPVTDIRRWRTTVKLIGLCPDCPA